MLGLMSIPEPSLCRRRNHLRLLLVVLPLLGVGGLVAAGESRLGLAVFLSCGYLFTLGTLRPSSRLFGTHLRELNPSQARRGEVWLTFDDGPDPVTTPIILDILQREGVHAGFFLIGNKARRHPDLVKAIAAGGHQIGNHTQSHPAGRFWALPPSAMWREVADGQQTLTEVSGEAPVWFRPPVGHHNPFVFPILQALGLRMVLWNCRGYDAVCRDPETVRRRLEPDLRPGAIVLLHEGTPGIADLLEWLLQRLQTKELQASLPSD